MTTIEDAIKELEWAISQALPGMTVTVCINLSSGVGHVDGKSIQEPSKDKQHDKETTKATITLDELRYMLNAHVKAVGKAKVFALVEKYADGSRNPADIPVTRYVDLIKEIDELSLKGEDSEAA